MNYGEEMVPKGKILFDQLSQRPVNISVVETTAGP